MGRLEANHLLGMKSTSKFSDSQPRQKFSPTPVLDAYCKVPN